MKSRSVPVGVIIGYPRVKRVYHILLYTPLYITAWAVNPDLNTATTDDTSI